MTNTDTEKKKPQPYNILFSPTVLTLITIMIIVIVALALTSIIKPTPTIPKYKLIMNFPNTNYVWSITKYGSQENVGWSHGLIKNTNQTVTLEQGLYDLYVNINFFTTIDLKSELVINV